MIQDKYIMYLRKSRVDRDFSDEETLARHRQRLDELCRSLGITCDPVLEEVGSADSIASRPEMMRLLGLVESGQYAGVVCIDMDRLSRGSGADQALVINTFKYSGTKIITPAKTYDFAQDTDEQFAELGLFIAKQEYRQIIKRMQQGKVSAVKEGKYPVALAPYGYETYKLQGQKGYSLRIVPEQAEIVREIFRLRTEQLLGSCAIATLLNSSGYRDQRGNLWSMAHVRKILNDPTYTGKVRYGAKVKTVEMEGGVPVKHERPNHNPLICDGIHEPIIDQETFGRSQELRKRNQVPHWKRSAAPANPLAGVVRCALCGKAMLLRSSDKYDRGLYCPTPGCQTKSSYLHYVEGKVIEGLGMWLCEYETTGQQSEDFDRKISELEARLSNLHSEADKLAKRKRKAQEAYEDGIYSSEELSERLGQIRTGSEQIEITIERTASDLAAAMAAKKEKERYRPAVKKLIEHYSEISVPQRNKLLKEIVEKIEYTKTVGGPKHGQEFDLLIYPKLPQ